MKRAQQQGIDRRPFLVLIGCLLVAGVACSGFSSDPLSISPRLAWPPEDPRVSLEAVIAPRLQAAAGGKWVRWLTGQPPSPLFHRPYAAAWQDETLLVADPGAGRVARIGARGRIHLSPGDLFQDPIGVAACRAGVVVSDARAGKLALLDEDLKLVRWLAVDLSRPTGVACSDDRIFVAETAAHRIVILEADGSRRLLGGRGTAPGEFNFPTAVSVAGDSLWVGDVLNFRIQRLDLASGEFLASFGQLGDAAGEMPRIKGIAVDRAGHLWVSDAHLDQVSLYTPDGTFLMAFGRRGADAGEFSFPAGIAAHADGRVAVVDSLNRRVQVFRSIDREPETES